MLFTCGLWSKNLKRLYGFSYEYVRYHFFIMIRPPSLFFICVLLFVSFILVATAENESLGLFTPAEFPLSFLFFLTPFTNNTNAPTHTRRARSDFVALRWAATCIQAVVRCRRQRTSFVTLRRAAICVQSLRRSIVSQRELIALRRTKAAVSIQRTWKMRRFFN